MKVKKLYNGNGYIVFSTDSKRPDEWLHEAARDLWERQYQGEVIFDLLACNASMTRRFFSMEFRGFEFLNGSLKLIKDIDREILLQANDFHLIDLKVFYRGCLNSSQAVRFMLQMLQDKSPVKEGDRIFHAEYGYGVMKELPTFSNGYMVTGVKSHCIKVVEND